MTSSAPLLEGRTKLDVFKDLSANTKASVLCDRNFILCFDSWICFF